jgi:signal transduction histidine kinase
MSQQPAKLPTSSFDKEALTRIAEELYHQKEELIRSSHEILQKNIELAKRNNSLVLLHSIDKITMDSIEDPKLVMQRLVEVLSRDSGFALAAIYLRHSSTTKSELVPQHVAVQLGNPTVQNSCIDLLMSHSIPLRHAQNPMARAANKFFIVSASRLFEIGHPNIPVEEAEQIQDLLGLKKFYCCPLQSNGEMRGVMVLGTSLEDLGFAEGDLLERLMLSVGIAVDNSLLYAESKASQRKLQTANRRLKDLDKAKDEFISMASHQLRTPLTSIKGYISMLEEGDAGRLQPQQKKFLKFAYSGADRMVGLISDLLNVSRMQAGKFTIQKAPADIVQIAEDETKLRLSQAEERGLKLVFEKPKQPLPLINLDENKTRQVIMNFIDNAIYYTRKGTIIVGVQRVGDRAELRVKDQGIGVPVEEQKKLFHKFYRAPNALAVRPDGTGLGLFLAKRVVEDQGGQIIFESQEGKGSTFGFSMPLK